MSLVISYIAGALAAIIASIPVGPITFAIVQATLNRGKLSGYMIAIGAIAVEMFFVVIAVFGLGSLIKGESVMEWLHLISIPVLILLGIMSLLKEEKEISSEDKSSKAGNYLLLGATLCFTNPIIVGYWVLISASLKERNYLQDTILDKTLFVLGIATGVVLFFSMVIQLTHWKKQSISVGLRNKINNGMGLFFVAFGIFLLLKYFGVHFEVWHHFAYWLGWIALGALLRKQLFYYPHHRR